MFVSVSNATCDMHSEAAGPVACAVQGLARETERVRERERIGASFVTHLCDLCDCACHV